MRQAGRYLPEYRALRAKSGGFLDFCYTPDLAVEATLQPIRRFAMNAAILFSDILVVPDALGQGVRFEEGTGPVLDAIASIENLPPFNSDSFRRHLAPVYEAVAEIKTALPDRTALIGFAGAPWTLACYMIEGGGSRDFFQVKGRAFTDADGFAALIDLLTEAVIVHLTAQIEAGAEAVQIFDSWAGILPEDAFRRWCIAPARRIVSQLAKSHPEVPVIGFPRGAGAMYPDYARETGIAAASLDTTVPLDWAVREIAPHCVLQGNLDPLLLVAGGAPLRTAVERILATLGDRAFVFNLGHGVVPQTPPEHVAELTRLLRPPSADERALT
ncbi:MAG: uroporphyrinogen decarboxylase [Alphaproteobacteria bacterium]